MPDQRNLDTLWKPLLVGAAAGMVISWAAKRFYVLARESSRARSMAPFLAGAAAGGLYANVALRRDVPLLARVPLGAALYLGEPEKTAAPPKGGDSIAEKAGHLALRAASQGLKKAAEKVLTR